MKVGAGDDGLVVRRKGSPTRGVDQVATGVGAVRCSRHTIVANGIVGHDARREKKTRFTATGKSTAFL